MEGLMSMGGVCRGLEGGTVCGMDWVSVERDPCKGLISSLHLRGYITSWPLRPDSPPRLFYKFAK